MVDQREWTVPCIDAVGRPRRLVVRAYAAAVVLGFPPAGSATIPPHRARALAMAFAEIDQTTAGAGVGRRGVHGGESRGCASKLTSRPVVPETTVGPGRAHATGPTVHHGGTP